MHAFKKQAEDRSIFRDFYRNNTYKNKRVFCTAQILSFLI